jgi:hypothetical protein
MINHERRSFPIGSRVKIQCTIVDEGGTRIDPGDVTFQIRTPDGADVVRSYVGGNVTRQSLGVYYAWLALDQSPLYRVRITATGSYRATTGDFEIPVDPSAFVNVDAWVVDT